MEPAFLLIGDGFKVLDLPEPLGRTVIGICMGKLNFSPNSLIHTSW